MIRHDRNQNALISETNSYHIFSHVSIYSHNFRCDLDFTNLLLIMWQAAIVIIIIIIIMIIIINRMNRVNFIDQLKHNEQVQLATDNLSIITRMLSSLLY